MSQFDFHSFNTPPRTNLSIIQKLIEAYKLWHQFIPHFPKSSRYTIGSKIDSLFLETIESVLMASYKTGLDKIPFIEKGSLKLDVLKFFLQISWEIKSLDSKKYIIISEKLNEIGRMLGGWQKQILKKKTSA